MTEEQRIEHQLRKIAYLLELILQRLPPPPRYYPSLGVVVVALP